MPTAPVHGRRLARAIPARLVREVGVKRLHNRWGILAVLFTVRLTMAFQFQSVPAGAPLLQTQFGVSLAEIGFLIGLFFTPGVALAPPGGGIGQRLGDRRSVLTALALMLVGACAMALGGSWGWQIAGRLLAGTALSLLALPSIGILYGVNAVFVFVAMLTAVGIALTLASAPMMSLPTRVLKPATRAIGMGVFYTFHYGAGMLGPIVAGAASKWTGSAAAAFDFGALVLCPLLLLAFDAMAARAHR